MSDEIELRLCPCCGEVDEYDREPIVGQNDDGCQRVRCRCCGLTTQWVSPKEDYTAEQLWNRRPIEDAQSERIADLEAERDNCKAALDEALSYLKLEGNRYKGPIERLKKFLVGEPPAINPYPIDPDNMCPYCCGTGQTHGEICDACHGTGKDHPENEKREGE